MYYEIIVKNYHGKNFSQKALNLTTSGELVNKISLDYVKAKVIKETEKDKKYEFLLKHSSKPTIVEVRAVGVKPFQ